MDSIGWARMLNGIHTKLSECLLDAKLVNDHNMDAR